MTVWLQVTSGRGPAECEWVVGRLTETLLREAADADVRTQPIEEIAGSHDGTFRSVVLSLDGPMVEDFASRNVGTVQWIGRSTFRPDHKRKNWFVGVEIFHPPTKELLTSRVRRRERCHRHR